MFNVVTALRGRVGQDSYLGNLERGQAGETRFRDYLNRMLDSDFKVLYDVSLKYRGSERQIDALLFFRNNGILFEVKNYEGSYDATAGTWSKCGSETRIDSPIEQLERTERFLQQIFRHHNIKIMLQSYVVFVGSNFYLYNSPINKQLVFPTQVRGFLSSLNDRIRASGLMSANDKRVLDVIEMYRVENTRRLDYYYTFDGLKKGLRCLNCGEISVKFSSRGNCECERCGEISKSHELLRKNIEEFVTLFPDDKVTVKQLEEWTGYTFSKRTLIRTIQMICEKHEKGRNTHYSLKKNDA